MTKIFDIIHLDGFMYATEPIYNSSNKKACIIKYYRGKGNMIHSKVGDIYIYSYTTDGKDDPVCDMYINVRTRNQVSSTILFETNWASQIVSSNNPSLVDVPKLPDIPNIPSRIDDEYVNYCRDNPNERVVYSHFEAGYKAASSKKYTEENIVNFLKFLAEDHGHKYYTQKDAWDDFKKSLSPIPKQVELEMDAIPADRAPNGWDVFVKVVNNFVVPVKWIYE